MVAKLLILLDVIFKNCLNFAVICNLYATICRDLQ